MRRWDAVVVGSGPNGMAAAITMARAGRSVLVLEAADEPGGGMRSGELTLPGFTHDLCAAVHPLAASSPFFRSLPLEAHGCRFVHPQLPLAHPFPDGPAATLTRELGAMLAQFPEDAAAYRRLFAPLLTDWRQLAWEFLQPVLHVPRHPLLLARFGLPSLLSAAGLSKRAFSDDRLRALFAGCAGHAILPLDKPLTASFGIVLAGAAHAVGWPFVEGGTGRLTEALAAYLGALGGEIETARPVRSLEDLPPHGTALFDTSPAALLEICGGRLKGRYRRSLQRFRRGEAVFKMDFALSGPIPWKDEACRRAGTVHLGGHLKEMVSVERAVARGGLPAEPFVLVSQPTLADPRRAPEGKHIAWAYCHLPKGADIDMSDAIERRIESFAPGFRDLILARACERPAELERRNPNMAGGDIAGGSNGGLQLFFRPRFALDPYRTPANGIYLCSASTPPGGGVHGMAGYWAARSALKHDLC